MQLLDLTLPTLDENLALDEALLLEAEAGRGSEVVRLWEWPTLAVVMGSGCKRADDVNEANCQADSIPIQRRSSGGGTVLLGSGCLCFTVVLAYERSPLLREIKFSYIYILDRVCKALAGLLPDIGTAGTSDLVSLGRKFSGNAQQRKRNYLLHHGTLLYNFEIARVGRYLHIPERQPAYRDQRPHDAFVQNLPVDAAELRGRLRKAWEVDSEKAAWPDEMVRQLVVEKYGTAEWPRRR